MRCGAHPLDNDVSITFLGPPQPGPDTSMLSLNPVCVFADGPCYDPKILTLFDDFTHAIYQSKWTRGDIW